jgi:ribonuclease HI
MNCSTSQYHLFAEACRSPQGAYHWHFQLDATNGALRLDVTDEEPGAPLDRLELWAVVRGLEALDQPSRVTLSTPSRYVNHGLRYGLQEWRESGWQWESFGQMTPIKNEDLWKRIDQAVSIHRVQCRLWRADEAVSAVPQPAFARRKRTSKRAVVPPRERIAVAESRTPWSALRQRVAGALMGLGQVIAPPGASAVAG